MTNDQDLLNRFRQFMNIHWLRPEAGMFKTYDFSVLQDIFPLPEPSIDLCCGDGISSFIWAGGEFDITFDMYHSVNTEQMYEQDVDVFDCYQSEKYSDFVTRRPAWAFTCGLDLKESLISKARTLDFYPETVVHNLDEPMPFSEAFSSAFSTSFWESATIDQCRLRLKNIHAILKPGGRFVFRLHETKLKQMMFRKYYEQFGFEWARRLDRHMYANNPDDSLDINWWIETLKHTGFAIKHIHQYVPRLIIWFYLVGFRPMFTSFMKMYRLLDPEKRIDLKRQWLSDLESIFTEFVFEKNIQQLDPSGGTVLYMLEAEKI